MTERAFKSMGSAAATSIVIGIGILIGGIVSGVLLLVHAGKLLSRRKDLEI